MNDFPPDAKDLLSEAAQKRIERAIAEGMEKKRAAELTFEYGNEESTLTFRAARFDVAFSVMSITLAELKAAGVRGQRLAEIMNQEIQGTASSLELGAEGEKQLRDLLTENDFGW